MQLSFRADGLKPSTQTHLPNAEEYCWFKEQVGWALTVLEGSRVIRVREDRGTQLVEMLT